MPGIQKIKEIIEEKALGELCFFNINVHAMAYAHALDLLSFFGGKILTVSGSFKNDNSIRKFRDTDWSIYDKDILYVPSVYASVTSEFENACIGVVNSSYYLDLEAFILSVEAVFQMGALTLNGINLFDCVGNLTYRSKEKLRKVDMNYRKGVFTNGFDYTFYRSIESFMRNYAEGKAPEIPGEQGLFNIELEKAIYQSNQQRCKILMSEFCRNL
jgi:predicted dehydrogenase